MPHFQAIGQWNDKTSSTDYPFTEYRGYSLPSVANRLRKTLSPEWSATPDAKGTPKKTPPTNMPTTAER